MVKFPNQKIRSFTRRLYMKESFLSYVFTLMTGTAISGAINAAVLPILSRCYAPDSFGILSIFTGMVSLVAVWAAWRYELAIVLPDQEEDAGALMKLSFAIVVAMSLVCLVVAVTLGETLTAWFNISYMDFWLILLPISILLAGLYNVFFYWCSRNKRFDRIAIAKVFQNIATLGSQLSAFFLFTVGAGGLISGYIIGQFAGVGILATQAEIEFIAALTNHCLGQAVHFLDGPLQNLLEVAQDILRFGPFGSGLLARKRRDPSDLQVIHPIPLLKSIGSRYPGI